MILETPTPHGCTPASIDLSTTNDPEILRAMLNAVEDLCFEQGEDIEALKALLAQKTPTVIHYHIDARGLTPEETEQTVKKALSSPATFQPGDVVQLKSGGPVMTVQGTVEGVSSLGVNYGPAVSCIRFDGSELKHVYILPAGLKKIQHSKETLCQSQ